MVKGIAKKIVVIKDVPSNIIEEAILILKEENEAQPGENVPEGENKHIRDDDFLLKEAELIINSYLKEYRQRESGFEDKHKKTDVFRKKLVINIIINSVLTGSVALLMFLIMKLI